MRFPEEYRLTADSKRCPPDYRTERGDPFGAFRIPPIRHGKLVTRTMNVIATDGKDTDWEHVSVSLDNQRGKCPSWDEMCLVKNLFWEPDATVVQFHPDQTNYVNHHPGCLHLWRHKDGHHLPPTAFV